MHRCPLDVLEFWKWFLKQVNKIEGAIEQYDSDGANEHIGDVRNSVMVSQVTVNRLKIQRMHMELLLVSKMKRHSVNMVTWLKLINL